MITPLTITSLNQGKELARWQVERLYAEPSATQVVAEAMSDIEAKALPVQIVRPERASFVSRFLAFWQDALPGGASRI